MADEQIQPQVDEGVSADDAGEGVDLPLDEVELAGSGSGEEIPS